MSDVAEMSSRALLTQGPFTGFGMAHDVAGHLSPPSHSRGNLIRRRCCPYISEAIILGSSPHIAATTLRDVSNPLQIFRSSARLPFLHSLAQPNIRRVHAALSFAGCLVC